MVIKEDIQKKIDYYEQAYFGLDKPVPFKKGLKIYPVKVKDYYTFYSCIPCLNMDKNVKKIKVMDEHGMEVEKEVSNPKGIGMSYMAYLIECMESKDFGTQITKQVIELLELVLHIKNGYYCPNCHQDEISYEDMYQDILKMESDKSLTEKELNRKKQEYFYSHIVCPHCGKPRREIFSIKEDTIKKLCIYDNELSPKEFEELAAIIMHQNILDYEGDKYMDPKLKQDMEDKARLENKNYSAPSLEKQLVCISISSPYTFEELQEITLRKMTLMLKTIDAKNTYYCQLSGVYSGMVKFKEDPKHWIFSDNKRDFSKEIMTLNDIQQKFAAVT